MNELKFKLSISQGNLDKGYDILKTLVKDKVHQKSKLTMLALEA